MERRNKYLAILLAVLSACTVLLFWQLNYRNDQWVDADLFRVDQLDKIDRFTLTSTEGKVELRFEEGQWRVNDKYEADRNLVKVFFATMEQMVPKREVAGSNSDSLLARFSDSHVKVSLFEKEVERLSFLVDGDGKNGETFAKKEESALYLMKIPGYRVYVAGIFEAGEGVWREKRIFDFNWRNFKQLKAVFPASPSDNFTVVFKDGYFGIDQLQAVDTTKMNDYLDAVSLLQATEYVTSEARARYDSMLNSTNSFSIEVSDIAGRSYALDLYKPLNATAQVPGRTHTGEIVLFERSAIAPIAKGRQYFSAPNQ